MKTSNAKAKGRKLCQELQGKLLASCPTLDPSDITVTSSGAPGEDLKLSKAARDLYPFTFECKNQEKLNIWAALKQAESHALNTEHTPVLVFSKNRSETYACLKLDDLLRLFLNPKIKVDS